MTRGDLLDFLRHHRLCVQNSVTPVGAPQSAVVGFGVSDGLEIVFDTVDRSRKIANLRPNPGIAVVVGWDDEQTAQFEGIADEPSGDELERIKAVYFRAYPDGVARQSWPGITYVRVRPHWARFSEFRPGGSITEFSQRELRGAGGQQLTRLDR